MIPLQALNRRILDLKASKVDTEKSTPANYVFKGDKKYYSKRSKPKFITKWCTVPNEKERGVPLLKSWEFLYGFTPVKFNDFDYWVEGITPDGSGHCIHGDAILVKIPIEKYVEKVKADRKASVDATVSGVRSFKARTQKTGGELKNDIVSDILGIDSQPNR